MRDGSIKEVGGGSRARKPPWTELQKAGRRKERPIIVWSNHAAPINSLAADTTQTQF